MSDARGRTGCAAIRTVQARTRTLGHSLASVKSSAVRTRTAQWYRDVAQLKRDEPFCRDHTKRGEHVVAVETDHIVPLVRGGSNERSNLQRLCLDCHRAKTASEHDARYVY